MVTRRTAIRILGRVWVLGVVAAVLSPAWSARAMAQSRPSLTDPLIYQVNLNGMTGWDVTPELVMNIFGDVDRTFSDLIHVHDPGPNMPDQIVQAEAWPNHVVVLRLDLTHDMRATNLDTRVYAARFARVIQEQVDLRNRRVAVWVRRADDAASFIVGATPEVFLIPGAESRITPEFVEAYSRGDARMIPEAPSLEGLPVCTTHADLIRALGMPETTSVIYGDAQRILDRWAQFRDDMISQAELAIGEQWEEYLRIIDDPDAPEFKKITARRNIDQSLKRAHTFLIRYSDLTGHPTIKPLAAQVLQRIKTLSETPKPGR